MPTPRQWFRDALADFRSSRTGNQRRAQIRADVAEMVNAAQDWLARTYDEKVHPSKSDGGRP